MATTRAGLTVMLMPGPETPRVNPYIPLLANALRELTVEVRPYRRRDRRPTDALLINWPDSRLWDKSYTRSALRLVSYSAILLLARLRGTVVVWTVHNLGSHDVRHPSLERCLRLVLDVLVGATIHLSEAGRRQFAVMFSRLARKPSEVVHHGHYQAVYGSATDPAVARERLGVPQHTPLLLVLGGVRPYKRVESILSAFRGTDLNAHLMVCGRSWSEDLTNGLHQISDADPRIELRLGRVSEEDMNTLLSAGDVLVMGHKDSLNSGIGLLGLSYDLGIIAPRIDSLMETHALMGGGGAYFYDGELTSEMLQAALGNGLAARTPRDRTPLEWSTVAGRSAAFLETVTKRRD